MATIDPAVLAAREARKVARHGTGLIKQARAALVILGVVRQNEPKRNRYAFNVDEQDEWMNRSLHRVKVRWDTTGGEAWVELEDLEPLPA